MATKKETLEAPADAISEDGGMPTVEELLAVSKALYDAEEYFVNPLQRRVLRLLNKEDGAATDISYETVGRLLVELTNMKYILKQMLREIEVLEESRDDLVVVVHAEGRVEHAARFNEYGKRAA